MSRSLLLSRRSLIKGVAAGGLLPLAGCSLDPDGAMPPLEIDYGLAPPAKQSADNSGGRPPRMPRFLDESFDDTPMHIFCGRRGCTCCIGP